MIRPIKHCGAERNGLGFWECDAAHCPMQNEDEPDPVICDYPQDGDNEEKRLDDLERARDMRSVK